MKTAYKIIGDFQNIDFESLLNKISCVFDFMYLDNTLFLALRDYSSLEAMEKCVKNTLNSSKKFLCMEIQEEELSKLPEVVSTWMIKHLINLDTQKYESENQKSIEKAMEALYKIEQDLENIVLENKKEKEKIKKQDNVSTSKEKTSKTENNKN